MIDMICDLWPCLHKSHQAWTSWKLGSIAHSHGRKQEILYFLEIALTNCYQLLICQAFTFTTLGFMWKWWHKMSTSPYDQCSILPARTAKVQGHTYCELRSHGLSLLVTYTDQFCNGQPGFRKVFSTRLFLVLFKHFLVWKTFELLQVLQSLWIFLPNSRPKEIRLAQIFLSPNLPYLWIWFNIIVLVSTMIY